MLMLSRNPSSCLWCQADRTHQGLAVSPAVFLACEGMELNLLVAWQLLVTNHTCIAKLGASHYLQVDDLPNQESNRQCISLVKIDLYLDHGI